MKAKIKDFAKLILVAVLVSAAFIVFAAYVLPIWWSGTLDMVHQLSQAAK